MATIDGIPLVTRTECGLRPPESTTRLPVQRVNGCALHYSASGAPASHADCDNAWRAIQRYHMDVSPEHYVDIAYNWGACRHGYLYRLRGLNVRSGANGTTWANSHFYAICVLGTDNKSRADITPELRRALNVFFVWLNRQIPGPMEVCPHSKFRSTTCPGDELRAYLRATGWECKV
jgi:hypothetical protein